MKKVLSLLLAAMLVFSSVPGVFAAFADEAKWPSSVAWAKSQINYMVEKGVLNGYAEDNTFRPADPVTRVQFIKMIVETFGLTKTAAISYTDVKSTDWFYPYVQKAAAQGFLLNYGTQLNPNGELTREEAASLLVRYLGLDADKKAPSNTYKDYNSIKIKYQDYVLQATYEGLFNGDETGNFSPARVLRRCEAAAILYRAAGTIYKATATGIDAGAADENAVIAKSGITVTNADIKGKLYISEGASGSTVTLSGCEAETVIVRAASSLILSDCEIDEIIVDSATAGYITSITMIGDASIGKITASTPVEISLSSRSTIDAMTVESGAKNSSVTGSGTLKSVTVKASGFKADKVPDKYEIASGLTASFANTSYSGATADTSASGFVTAPSLYSATAGAYLKAKPSVSGVLYYYYTNTATAPTKTNYITNYTAATMKSNFSVTANSSYDKQIGKTADVSGYSYVAVMLQATNGTMYQPMLLANKSSSGFVGTPTLSVSGTYDQLTLKTSVSGQVSYYYSKTNTAPTVDTFSTMYNAAAYKGTVSATANQQVKRNTVLSNSVVNYPYVILMVKDSAGNTYQPVIISDGATVSPTTDSGFTTTPFCRNTSDTIYLGMASDMAGTVEFYYTASSTLPTSAQFTTTFASAQASAKGTIPLSSGVSYYNALPNQVIAKAHKYIVLRLTVSGVSYQPVLVALPAVQAADLTDTGFASQPTTSMTDGYFYLSVSVTSPGTLKYYITDNPTAPSVEAFDTNWANKTSQYLTALSGGIATLKIGTQSVKTAITNEVGATASYIVLMNTIVGQRMKPIVIPLLGATTGGTTVQPTTSGLIGTPTYSEFSKRVHQITLTSNLSGTIYYYYTDNATAPDADEIKRIVEIETSAGQITGAYAGVHNVLAKQTTDISVEIVNRIMQDYVVLMLVDSNGIAYRPVVISTAGVSGGGTATENVTASGFTARPTAKLTGTDLTLSYSAAKAGQVLYYFTTSPSAPATSAAFINTYYMSGMSGTLRGTFEVKAGSATKVITAPSGYSYLVLLLQKETVAQGEDQLCQPIVVSVNGASVGGTAGFFGTPYVNGDYLYYSPMMTGTFEYYFTNASNKDDFESSIMNQPSLMAAGGSVTITKTGEKYLQLSTAHAALGNLVKDYDYIVIWMKSGGVTSDPVFVSMAGTSGSGQTGANGFKVAPHTDSTYVFFTPSVSGTLKYFYTNSTKQYTAGEFANTHPSQVQNKMGNSIPVTANLENWLDTTAYTSYKYLWVMLTNGTTNYTPVRIQLP